MRIESGLNDGRPTIGKSATLPDAAGKAANESLLNRIGTWRTTTGLAMAASRLLAILLALRGPALPSAEPQRYLAVLQSPAGHTTGWWSSATAGDSVRLIPIGEPVAVPPGKILQFWIKPKGATGSTSLGLVRAGETAVVPVSRLPGLSEQQLFEVTPEPEGGSTIGKPTGPVLYVGTAVLL